jgi:hypothetical protein
MFLGHYHDNRAEYRAAKHYYDQVASDFADTPLAERAQERVTQIAGLPAVPPQRLPWLVAMFPESDKVKPLIEATKKMEAEEQAATQLASQQGMNAAGGVTAQASASEYASGTAASDNIGPTENARRDKLERNADLERDQSSGNILSHIFGSFFDRR